MIVGNLMIAQEKVQQYGKANLQNQLIRIPKMLDVDVVE